MNDSKQRSEVIDGLEYISKAVRRYAEIEHIYLHGDHFRLKEALEAAVKELYILILEYEASAARQFHRPTAVQTVRNVLEVDGWKDTLGMIKESEAACNLIVQRIDAADQHIRMKRLESAIAAQNRKVDELILNSRVQDEDYEKHLLEEFKAGREEHRDWRQTDEERDCHQAFRTSEYEAHMARTPSRVDGTCEWFLKHPNFENWRNSTESSLLWVSADPGCGKSVLSRFLVESELCSTDLRTTCYFFFKDDNVDQKSVMNAFSALLHQLFSQKKALLKHAVPEFRSNGKTLPQLFSKQWDILLEAAADPDAGSITCILDALDECEKSDQDALIKTLGCFYHDLTNGRGKNVALKFLVTSRPYYDIERRFQSLTHKLPTIRLAGEEETESIRREIDLFIKFRVPEIAENLGLDKSVEVSLQNDLLAMTHRTYLWLKLVLEVICNRLDATTEKRLRKIVGTIPDTVDKAYEAILDRSQDKGRAKKLLHIVVAAVRPLTLQEMNIALAIEEGCKSYEDLDLESEERFKITVRNLCGLFVSVIDSRIYLIHQTAKEFLVVGNNSGLLTAPINNKLGNWKQSLDPGVSNLVIAEVCILYLLFDVFESTPLDEPLFWEVTEQYTSQHYFLEYAAVHWPVHLREAKIGENTALLNQKTYEVCDT